MKSREENTYHRITKDEAAALIYNFLSDATLRNIGIDNSIGGLIDLSRFSEMEFDGIAFWYCWNTDYEMPEIPKFFLAYETNQYDSAAPGQTEIREDILGRVHDDYIINYPSLAGRSLEEVIYFLENAETEWDNSKEEDMTISKDEVAILTNNFMNHFPGSNSANAYNDYPFGFFISREILEDLIPQGPFVRYYFGYDAECEDNEVRIILVSVNEEGANLVSEEYVLIENSFPPGGN